MYTHTHTRMHKYTHTHTNTHVDAHAHTHIQIRMYTHTHTHIHTCTHAHRHSTGVSKDRTTQTAAPRCCLFKGGVGGLAALLGWGHPFASDLTGSARDRQTWGGVQTTAVTFGVTGTPGPAWGVLGGGGGVWFHRGQRSHIQSLREGSGGAARGVWTLFPIKFEPL